MKLVIVCDLDVAKTSADDEPLSIAVTTAQKINAIAAVFAIFVFKDRPPRACYGIY